MTLSARQESRLRRLTRSIQKAAGLLRPHAEQDLELANTYNELCKVLDALNARLSREAEGSLAPTWRLITSIRQPVEQ